MKHIPLFMVSEDDSQEWLSMDVESGDKSRPAKPADITIEAMAEMLDQDAENCNAHDFAGCHFKLAALLHAEHGRAAATKTFRRLVDYRGLHGMEGVCGEGDPDAVMKDLKLPRAKFKD